MQESTDYLSEIPGQDMHIIGDLLSQRMRHLNGIGSDITRAELDRLTKTLGKHGLLVSPGSFAAGLQEHLESKDYFFGGK